MPVQICEWNVDVNGSNHHISIIVMCVQVQDQDHTQITMRCYSHN